MTVEVGLKEAFGLVRVRLLDGGCAARISRSVSAVSFQPCQPGIRPDAVSLAPGFPLSTSRRS